MIKNKKGWIRIVEVTIAILLIIGSVVLVIEQKKPSIQEDLSERFAELLEEAVKDTLLRDKIISSEKKEDKEKELRNYLSSKIDSNLFLFEVKICDASESSCPEPGNLPGNKEVYTNERIVSVASTTEKDQYNPQRVRLFAWRK